MDDALNGITQAKGAFMTFTRVILALACLMSGTLAGQEAKVTELMSKDLTEFQGKEGLMITVDYPPGSTDPIHRHNAHGFIYVLEGSIVMQVRGGKEVTLGPGQTFYEGPDDVHVVGRNASKTKPAKFVVFFVKNKGAPICADQLKTEIASGSARRLASRLVSAASFAYVKGFSCLP